MQSLFFDFLTDGRNVLGRVWRFGLVCAADPVDPERDSAREHLVWEALRRSEVCFPSGFMSSLLMTERRLDDIIRACCLEHDIEMLPHGALTQIGEKGINLSG